MSVGGRSELLSDISYNAPQKKVTVIRFAIKSSIIITIINYNE